MPPRGKSVAKKTATPPVDAQLEEKGLVASKRPKAKAAPSRFLARRSTEEQATRAIQTQCGSISKDVIALTRIDGKTVLKQVMEDKRAARPDKKKLGPTYWAGIKKKYNLSTTLSLQPKSKDERINEDLLHALSLARSSTASAKSHTAGGISQWSAVAEQQGDDRPLQLHLKSSSSSE